MEAAFPNSIILAANYSEEGILEELEGNRWRVEMNGGGNCTLVIPTPKKLASIIDGQHRLYGFEYASVNTPMHLLCAVYLDLPRPYQAYLFATINFNQVKVDRSLAYELWGTQVEDEPPESWAPEKAAVRLCRKLNVDSNSPLHQHIVVAAQDDALLFKNKPANIDWVVSTATIVDGILRLISSDPKKDRDIMHAKRVGFGRKRKMLAMDRTPLRELYLEANDLMIFTIIKNFFSAVNDSFWNGTNVSSYIKKTIGIQALFDILRLLAPDFMKNKDVTVKYFVDKLTPAKAINFSDMFFQASGLGRTRVRNAISLACHLIELSAVKAEEVSDYTRILQITE